MMRYKSLALALLMAAMMIVGSRNVYAYYYTGGTRSATPVTITLSADPSKTFHVDLKFTNDSNAFTVNSPSAGEQYTVGQTITLSVTPKTYYNTVLPGGFSSNAANNIVMTILKGDTVKKTFRTNYYGEDLGKTFTDSFTPSETGTYKVNIYFRGSTYSGSNYGNFFIKVVKAPAGAKIGSVNKVSGQSYKVLSKTAVAFTKAANKKSVAVPNTVKIKNKTYKVTQISKSAFKGSKIRTVTINKNITKIAANAFKGSKVSKIILKTGKLTKKSVKGSLNGSKVKTVLVKVNKNTLKNYKKIFVKKVVGKKVTVK